MTTPTPGEITELLRQIEQGNPDAHERLARLARASLKRIAAKRLRRLNPSIPAELDRVVWKGFKPFVERVDIAENPQRPGWATVPCASIRSDANIFSFA